MARISLTFTIILLLGFSWIGYIPNVCSENSEPGVNVKDEPEYKSKETDFNITSDSKHKRTKRNTILGANPNSLTNSPTNIEGLLSSCQLTNLLLYQLLNQRFSNPLAASSNNILQPFPAGVAGLGGLAGLGLGLPGPIAINPYAPVLQTITTTSTYLTEMTTTSIHTITLLFGNKESMTTLTQTKVFNATTSTVLTLTSTVQPTPSTPLEEFKPTATLPPILPTKFYEEQPNEIVQKKYVQETAYSSNVPVEQKPPRQKQRRNRKFARQKNVETSVEHDYEGEQLPLHDTSSTIKFGQNFTPKKKHFTPESPTDDEFYYNQKDYNGRNNYYVRRLKRRGEVEDDIIASPSEGSHEYDNPNLEREYLLEPSSDASFAENIAVQACPMPKEITVTKTVTKFVNPPNSIRLNGDNNDSPRLATKSYGNSNNEASILAHNPDNEIGRVTPRFKSNRTPPSSSILENQRSSENNLGRTPTSGVSSYTENSPRESRKTSGGRQESSETIRSINDNRRYSRYRNSPTASSSPIRLPITEKQNEPETARSRFIKRISYIKK